MELIEVTEQTFEEEALKVNGKIVLVVVGHQHCPACLDLVPIMEALSKELSEQIKVVKVNALESRELVNQLSISLVPTVVFYTQDKKLLELAGENPKALYLKIIKMIEENNERDYSILLEKLLEIEAYRFSLFSSKDVNKIEQALALRPQILSMPVDKDWTPLMMALRELSHSLPEAKQKAQQKINLYLRYNSKLNLSELAGLGQFDKIAFLLAQGEDINQAFEGGYTALTFAIMHKNYDVAKQMLEVGAMPFTQDADGCSALYCAIASNDERAVKLLCPYTSDINECKPFGKPLAHLALISNLGSLNIPMIENLIQQGMDIYQLNDTGNTAFEELQQKISNFENSPHAKNQPANRFAPHLNQVKNIYAKYG